MGVSDLIGLLESGRFVAIEAKTGTGRPTPAQKVFLASVERNGGLAIVARSVEDVAAAIVSARTRYVKIV